MRGMSKLIKIKTIRNLNLDHLGGNAESRPSGGDSLPHFPHFPPGWSRFGSNLLKMPASLFEADGTTCYRRIELSWSVCGSYSTPLLLSLSGRERDKDGDTCNFNTLNNYLATLSTFHYPKNLGPLCRQSLNKMQLFKTRLANFLCCHRTLCPSPKSA